jgi:hypothetical protein
MYQLSKIILAFASFQGLLVSGAAIRSSNTFQINTYSAINGCSINEYTGSYDTSSPYGAQPTWNLNGQYVGTIDVIQIANNAPNVVIVDGQTVWDGCSQSSWPDPSACVTINKNVNQLELSFDGCNGLPGITTKN